MNVWDSPIYLNDLANVQPLIDIETLQNKKILITGATGLICSAIVDLLVYSNLYNGTNISIYAAGRTKDKFEKRFPSKQNSGLYFVEYDAAGEINFDFSVDYIIHGASNASPDKYISEPVNTMLANIVGTHNLMKYAIKSKLSKFIFISSSEVYGKLSHGNPLKEKEYGSTDILSYRAAYPVGKQAAETLCISYANQYGIKVSIVRPGHIYGPTAQESDNRVSSLFVRQAVNGMNITMKSAGSQIRSYCYCIDCASAILSVLTRGNNEEAYNISNKNSIITIRQMADVIARYANVRLIVDIPSEEEKSGFNPMNNSSLNSEKLELLGWEGQFDAEKGFSHAIAVLREIK